MSKITNSEQVHTSVTTPDVNNLASTQPTKKRAHKKTSTQKELPTKPALPQKEALLLSQRNTSVTSVTTSIQADTAIIATHLPSLQRMSPLIQQHLLSHSFNSASFCSGYGKEESSTIDKLATAVLKNAETSDINTYFKTVLAQLNALEKANPALAAKVSFPLRTAILLAAQRSGSPMESWQVYTFPFEGKDQDFWQWIEKPSSWIPEAQALKARFFQNSFIQALSLAKQYDSPTVAMLKGGFGAGKTSYITTVYGDAAKGVIGPDTAKKMVRKPMMEVSHGRVHLQSSDAAFSQFDALINQMKGTVVYDSSLSRSSDVARYLLKAEKAGKALKVSDITRDDTARALAVLSRSVEGEDPRVPLSYLLKGANLDRAQRPDCMNAVLHPNTDIGHETIKQPHTYELFACDDTAADRRHVLTITAGGRITWAPEKDISKEEAIHRLNQQGIVWDEATQCFSRTNPDENWHQALEHKLNQPVSELVQRLNEKERCIRTTTFSQRILPVMDLTFTSPETLYDQLSETFTTCISKESFVKAFNVIDQKHQQTLLTTLQEKAVNGETFSYMDLPASIALSLHAELKRDPWKPLPSSR